MGPDLFIVIKICDDNQNCIKEKMSQIQFLRILTLCLLYSVLGFSFTVYVVLCQIFAILTASLSCYACSWLIGNVVM